MPTVGSGLNSVWQARADGGTSRSSATLAGLQLAAVRGNVRRGRRALEQAASLDLVFRKDPALTKHFRERGLRDEAWTLGTIGGETVIAVGCSRSKGSTVMGPHGRLGSAAKGVRYLAATGDFADELRAEDVQTGLTLAPRNAARFVLSSLVNDARIPAGPEEP